MSLTTMTKKKTTRIRGSTHIGGLNQPPSRSYREVVSPAVYSEKQYKQFCQLHSLNNLIRHRNPEAPVTKPTEIVQWFVKVIQDNSDYPYPHHKQALADSFDTHRGNFTDSAFALWAFMAHRLSLRCIMEPAAKVDTAVSIKSLHDLIDELHQKHSYPFQGLIVHSQETTGSGRAYGHASTIIHEHGRLLWLDPETSTVAP